MGGQGGTQGDTASSTSPRASRPVRQALRMPCWGLAPEAEERWGRMEEKS